MHPTRIFSVFLLLIVLSLAPSSAGAQGDQVAEEAASKPPVANSVAVEDVVDDQAIQQRLKRILESRERYSDVGVEVENGVVTFDGQAETDQDRVWVEELAERTEGVVVVDNQIEVDAAINLEGNLEVIQTSLLTLWRDFLKRLPLLVAAFAVLVITAVTAKVVGSVITRLLRKRGRLRSSLKDLLKQLTTIGIWVLGLVISAVVVFPGLTPAKALTVLGLGSVAIGFAFKDIFENFFAGLLILWRYPFDRGDFISCDGITGRVQEITVRNTMIRRLDGELTVIPNAHLFKSKVDILTNQNTRRVQIICGIAYDEDVVVGRQTILQALQRCSSVDTAKPTEVFAQEFADSSINFEVSWWTKPTPTDIRSSRDEVVESIKDALDEAGIEIPFPYRTLTFKDPLAISDDRGRNAACSQSEHHQS